MNSATSKSELRDAYFESLRGMRLRVLAESPLDDRPGQMVGTSCRYSPTVVNASQAGDFVEVTAGDVIDGQILQA